MSKEVRLIDANALDISKCNPEVFVNKDSAYGWYQAMAVIDAAPTVESEPVLHGKWLPNCAEHPGFFVCSECNTFWYRDTKYCPNCGVKMDNGVDG